MWSVPRRFRAALHRGADGLGPGVGDQRLVGVSLSAKWMPNFVTIWTLSRYGASRLAHQRSFWCGVVGGAVDLGGIKHRVADSRRLADGRHRFVVAGGCAVGMAETHAAQPDGRYGKVFAQCACFHGGPPCLFLSFRQKKDAASPEAMRYAKRGAAGTIHASDCICRKQCGNACPFPRLPDRCADTEITRRKGSAAGPALAPVVTAPDC